MKLCRIPTNSSPKKILLRYVEGSNWFCFKFFRYNFSNVFDTTISSSSYSVFLIKFNQPILRNLKPSYEHLCGSIPSSYSKLKANRFQGFISYEHVRTYKQIDTFMYI